MAEVGRNVERRIPVHAADPAGGKDLDPGLLGDRQRPGHRRAAAGLLGNCRPKVPHADLAQRFAARQGFQSGVIQPDPDLAVDHCGRGRYGPACPDGGFHIFGQVQILGVGQSVADHGRFQGDDRFAQSEGFGHFGQDLKMFRDHWLSFVD